MGSNREPKALPRTKKLREPITDPTESAKAAGLRYVSDTQPGIYRKRQGKGFRYVDADGKPMRDKETLARIKSLVIPPAWKDVWICQNPKGHLQATGRDARGRKQSRYHPRWREVRDETKYERMIVFGAALPAIRERVEHDLSLPGMPRPKILAAIVRLMETTLIRVGNSEYARQNHSYGLTTMRNKHVNDYLREMTNQDFTAKDFRTWAGTVLACAMLRECEAFESETQAKRNVVQVIKGVALRLGNTPSVCRKCYVHPDVLDCYMSGAIIKTMKQQVETESDDQSLRQEEVALLKLLQRRLALAAA
jgi:DNA topoisomerase IB